MSGVVCGRFDAENLAAQLIPDTAGYVAQQMQTKQVSDEYHQSKIASQGAGHITQTTIEQQWESQLINDAEFTANTQLPSVTFDINNSDISQQLGQRVGEEISHFYHPTPPPARNANGFWRGVDDVLRMREGTIEAFSSVVSNHYQMPSDRWEAVGYAAGVPLAMGAELIATEGILGLEAIETLYQGSQQVIGNVTSKLERWGLFGKQIASENTLRQRVLGNIAESQAASKTSNFLVLSAKENQMLAGYNPDAWSMINLQRGDVVYGGIPGQSAYYTSEKTILASGSYKDILFQSLQVRANPIFGYRSEVGAYEVTKDIRVPYGIVSSNPELGTGTGEQFFINNFSDALRLVDRIELKEIYNYDMSTFRPRP